MEGKTLIIIVLSGLCALPSCFPRQYHLVEDSKIWTEAQSYCREKFTDLATVDNQEDVAKLNDIIGRYHNGKVWIGLYDDINSWRWSLEKEGYYGEGEAEFRKWRVNEPGHYSTENCAAVNRAGKWWDDDCSKRKQIICYDGAIEAQDSSRFVFVNEAKTWTEAQSYCRERYTDLASVKNQAENDEMKMMIPPGKVAWIGLFRDSWKWSDGSGKSFSNWNTEEHGTIAKSCGFVSFGKWKVWPCRQKFYFACYSEPVKKQVVRVKMTKKDSSVNLEDVMEAILQPINQRLKDKKLSEDVKLRWVKQPDGKIFHKEEEKEEKEEMSCNLK
ncbi:secretory phospholipase A2 receptor-like isoform X2 [Centroberyx affinis]|uniref:secretory phospholipase A2 receptor-like isoform X2 n=1 Tax=Centroberyx affinis TaxID=166261 RepID=UPI003A5C2BFF